MSIDHLRRVRLDDDTDGILPFSKLPALPRPLPPITAATTIKVDDVLTRVNTAAGGVTVTLPPAEEAAKVLPHPYYIKKTGADGNNVTIAAAGTDDIDGAATLVFATARGSVTLLPRQAGWDIV